MAVSDVETFAAAACILDVRVVELEPFVQALACEIELEAVEVGQALRIDDDGYAVTFETQVLGLEIVGVFNLVGEPGATRRAHAEPQPETLAAPGKMVRNVLGRA